MAYLNILIGILASPLRHQLPAFKLEFTRTNPKRALCLAKQVMEHVILLALARLVSTQCSGFAFMAFMSILIGTLALRLGRQILTCRHDSTRMTRKSVRCRAYLKTAIMLRAGIERYLYSNGILIGSASFRNVLVVEKRRGMH